MPVPLELRDVTRLYGEDENPVVALQDISLGVAAGEFVALVGRSGCGKSTLLNLSGAMDFPTSGDVLIDGVSTTGLSDAELTRIRRENVGFIFQSFQLLHTLTALENVEAPLLLAGKSNARRTAREWLAAVDLADLENRYPHQLSGGQQQRVAIARALTGKPVLLLADEPTGNLDSATGEAVLQLLSSCARERGISVLMATHSAESTAVADYVATMRDGRIIEVSGPQHAEQMA